MVHLPRSNKGIDKPFIIEKLNLIQNKNPDADKIKKQPNMVKRFMRAGLRAMNYIRDNRADTMQMIMREFGMDQDIAALAYKVLLELLSPDGRNRVEGYQLLVDFARAGQKIDRPISAAQFIDETILDEIIREGSIAR